MDFQGREIFLFFLQGRFYLFFQNCFFLLQFFLFPQKLLQFFSPLCQVLLSLKEILQDLPKPLRLLCLSDPFFCQKHFSLLSFQQPGFFFQTVVLFLGFKPDFLFFQFFSGLLKLQGILLELFLAGLFFLLQLPDFLPGDFSISGKGPNLLLLLSLPLLDFPPDDLDQRFPVFFQMEQSLQHFIPFHTVQLEELGKFSLRKDYGSEKIFF